MQNLICAVALGVVATSALFDKKEPDKVEKTMTVNRCQAVLKDGTQCKGQAEGGKKAWESTKTWSTNAWESTKSGAKEAWQNTKDRAKEVQEGWNEIFGKESKKSAAEGR